MPKKTKEPAAKKSTGIVLTPAEARAAAVKKIEDEVRDDALIAVAAYMKQAPSIMMSASEATSSKSKVFENARDFVANGFSDDKNKQTDVVNISITIGGEQLTLISERPRKIEDMNLITANEGFGSDSDQV
jgi:hypothetical protein